MASKAKSIGDDAEAMLKWLEDPDDRSPTWVPPLRETASKPQSDSKQQMKTVPPTATASSNEVKEGPKPEEANPSGNQLNKPDSNLLPVVFELKKELVVNAEEASRQKIQYESVQGFLQFSHLLRISISTHARTTALRLKEVSESVQLGSSGTRSAAAGEELLELSDVNLSEKEKQDRITERNNRKLLTNDLIKDLYEANFRMSEELEKAVTFIQMFQSQLSTPAAGGARGRNTRR